MLFWKSLTEPFAEAKTAKRAMPIFLTMLLAAALFVGTKYLVTWITEVIYNFVTRQASLYRMDAEALILEDIGLIIHASGLGILLILATLYVRFLEGRPLGTMKLHKKGMGKGLLQGLLAGALLFGAVLAVLIFIGSLRFEGEVQTNFWVRLLCLLAVLLCGVSFEYYFRGFVLSSLGARCRPLLAVLLTAVLSTAAHSYYWGFSFHTLLNNLMLDLILGLLVLRFDSAWIACAARTVWLLLCQFVFGVVYSHAACVHALIPTTVDYSGIWAGSKYGIDSGYALTVLLPIALLLLFLVPKRVPREDDTPRPFMEHVPTDRDRAEQPAVSPALKAEPAASEKASVLRRPASLQRTEIAAEDTAEPAPAPDDSGDEEEWEEEETRVHVEPDYKKPEDYLK